MSFNMAMVEPTQVCLVGERYKHLWDRKQLEELVLIIVIDWLSSMQNTSGPKRWPAHQIT